MARRRGRCSTIQSKKGSNRVVMEINGAQTGAMQYDTIKEGVK